VSVSRRSVVLRVHPFHKQAPTALLRPCPTRNRFTYGAALAPLLGMAWLSWLLGSAANAASSVITDCWLGKKHAMARSRGEPPSEIPYSLIGQLDPDFSFVNGDALPGGGGGGASEAFPTPAPLSRPNAEFLCMAAKVSYEDPMVRKGEGGPSRGGGGLPGIHIV
jgi:predicted outer membrane lipoprotein